MSETVGYATLQIIPSMRGVASSMTTQASAGASVAGATAGKKMGTSMVGGMARMAGPMAGVMAGLGVAHVIGDSINLEKQFSQTMTTMGVAANVPKKGLESLSALAMKLGSDTTFSSNEAADAMLELAKSGIDAATIKAGALEGTLTLAAAGGTDLGTAATIASNALNTFSLKGSDMASVAAALAGGANASSASVESLGQGLQQVGPGAVNAGLSLQETVAALSAFDAAGIKGSDAGTSLKTMLSRLQPQTDKAATAMKRLGLDFVDAHGNFVPLSNVAEQLQTKLGGLSEAQRSQALTTIFGSDASRAATVLMKNGAKGIDKYTKATNDQDAAEKMAAARMSGTAGALESLSGSWETIELAIGQALAPLVQFFAVGLAGLLNLVLPAVQWLGKFSDILVPLSAALIGIGMAALAVAAAVKIWSVIQAILDAELWANPIGLVVLAIVGLVAAIVAAYQHSETFRKIVDATWAAVKKAIAPVLKFLVGTVWPIMKKVFSVIATIVKVYVAIWLAVIITAIKGIIAAVKWVWQITAPVRDAFGNVISFLGGVVGRVASVIGRIWHAITEPFTGIFDTFKNIAGDIASGIWQGLQDGAGWLADAVWQWVKDVLPRPVEIALGIASPSKVFKQLGAYSAEGLALGIEGGADRVAGASRAMAVGAANAARVPISADVRGDGSHGSALGIGGGPAVAHVYLDGKQISEAVFEHGGRKLAHGRR